MSDHPFDDGSGILGWSGSGRAGGRPSKFEPEHLDLARKLAKGGALDREIAGAIGISLTTFYRWKGEFRQFRDALKQGKAVADDAVEAALFRKATGYSHDAVKIMTKAIGDGRSEIVEVPFVEHVPPDTTAAIFWLKNRRPERWRDKSEVDNKVSGKLEVGWQPPEG